MTTLTLVGDAGHPPEATASPASVAPHLRLYRSLARKHGRRARHHLLRSWNLTRNSVDLVLAQSEAKIALRYVVKVGEALR